MGSLTMAAAESPRPLQLAWNASVQGGRLQVAPALICNVSCQLRFEITTLDTPAQKIRQTGTVRLTGGAPHILGRLALSTGGSQCRVQLTLWHANGQVETHVIDPCRDTPR
jgi:hypothetical protein